MSKTNSIKYFLTGIILWACVQNSFAQHNPILDNFSVFENNGKVFLNWAITLGSTCNGIQIYRSADNTNFIKIGDIAGICGSSSSPTPYNFTDNNPEKNKINCYRLELGGNGSSEILSLEIIDIASGGFQIRPNPVSTEAKIYFDNNKKQEHQFMLYNMSGISVLTTTTKEDFFLLNSVLLQSGIYLFTISTNENLPTIQGKLLVQH